MTAVTAEIIQYLQESRASQDAIVKMFRIHLPITPAGNYRETLERHVRQSRKHVRHLDVRLSELGARHGPVRLRLGFARSLVGEATTIAMLPLALLRSTGGRERLLSNAKDECATVAFALATHRALELVARVVGDEDTAKLATAIVWDQQSLLDKLLEAVNELAEAAISGELKGKPASAFDTARATQVMRVGARQPGGVTEHGRDEAGHVPGLSRSEGEIEGAQAAESDLPISDYGALAAGLVIEQLPQLSQIDLATIDGYERRHAYRTAVLDRIDTLRGTEPWPRYDEMNEQEIRSRLYRRNSIKVRQKVLGYERCHQNRSTVLRTASTTLTGP